MSCTVVHEAVAQTDFTRDQRHPRQANQLHVVYGSAPAIWANGATAGIRTSLTKAAWAA